jgi:ABC-type antimicrobial peptide transport system permease subunit
MAAGTVTLRSVQPAILGVTPERSAAVAVLFAVVAVVAASIPARRATRVDPLIALRTD